jgi:hypothetical protein
VYGGPRVGMLWNSEESLYVDQLILRDITARSSSLAQSHIKWPTLVVWGHVAASVGWHRGGGWWGLLWWQGTLWWRTGGVPRTAIVITSWQLT